MEQMSFFGWSKVYQYNGTADTPIFTAAQLDRMGLKPIDPEKYYIHWVVTFGCGCHSYCKFKFYTIDNTRQKRAYKKSVAV